MNVFDKVKNVEGHQMEIVMHSIKLLIEFIIMQRNQFAAYLLLAEITKRAAVTQAEWKLKLQAEKKKSSSEPKANL